MSERDIPNSMRSCLKWYKRFKGILNPFIHWKNLKRMKKTFDACLMDFIVIGELVWKLSDEFQKKHDYIEWYKIRAFRNFAAPEYFGIDAEKVWEIIQNKIPELKAHLEKIVSLSKGV